MEEKFLPYTMNPTNIGEYVLANGLIGVTYKITTLSGDSWWVGYVGIPKKHPWFDSDIDFQSNPIPEINVNGGITYSETKDGILWLGFDYAHGWNKGGGSATEAKKDMLHLMHVVQKSFKK